MNSRFLTIIFLIAFGFHAKGQILKSSGQYFQSLSIFSPALTGQDDFTNITTGYRQINIGLDNKPVAIFLNANTSLSYESNWVKSLQKRTSRWTGNESTEIKKNTMKVGLGGYLVSDRHGVFNELEGALNTAVHVPVKPGVFISLGISLGISNTKVDLSRLTVRDPSNDFTYLSYLQNGASTTFFNIGSSMALYAKNYFVSYGVKDLTQTSIGGNEKINISEASLTHNIIGGYTIRLNELMELIPSAFLRVNAASSLSYDLNVRWRYKGNFWTGLSYRNNSSYIGMLGFTVKKWMGFGYAYGSGSGNSEFSNNSHELVLGLKFPENKE